MSGIILHIDSSARRECSVTRTLSRHIVDQLGGTVIRRDLIDPLPQLDEHWLAANWTPPDQRTDKQAEQLALSDHLIDELKSADTIVVGAPIYNYGVPAALKAWIDLVCRAGETFRYGENGPEGLLEGKRAIVAIASGGTTIGSKIDFASGYLRHIFGFLGITDVQIVAAENVVALGDQAVDAAKARIEALAA